MPADRPAGVAGTPPAGLLEVGRLGRAHGVKGGVVVTLTSDRTERAQPGSRLFDGRQWLAVASSRSLPQGKWMVVFDGVDDRNAAELLTGRTLWGEPLADADALWVHELIGARVVDQDGIDRGRCIAVIDNPANDLLELDTGHLVPVTFVVSTSPAADSPAADSPAADSPAADSPAADSSDGAGDAPPATARPGAVGVIVVDVPDGLFELLD